MTPPAPTPRVVLITGAAGGLGTALTRAFAAEQWRVIAGYHRTPPTVSTRDVWPVQLDVTDGESVAATVRDGLRRWRRLDALVNNAGLTADGPLPRLGLDDWERVLDVNLKGAFRCAQAVLPAMTAQRAGHIVNIGSFSGRTGAIGQANYAAAKAGLLGLTQSLARETGPHNVRVNAVLPGVLRTAMTAGLNRSRLGDFAAGNALKRLNDPAEVARFVAFLVTLEHVSGQIFQLDSRIARWC
ncbi:MAG: SDR family NAD(P)-dependent oxidoreductase [Verrucomicrobia bacterium]|nr:SDR family NAD(P)-dependent oxidoreductase [Verrucomicrobiota bacterium]